MDFDNITDFTNIDFNISTSNISYIIPNFVETFVVPVGLIFGIAGFIICCCSQFRSGGKRESFTIMAKPIQYEVLKVNTPPQYNDHNSFRPIQSYETENPSPVYNTFVYVNKNLE